MTNGLSAKQPKTVHSPCRIGSSVDGKSVADRIAQNNWFCVRVSAARSGTLVSAQAAPCDRYRERSSWRSGKQARSGSRNSIKAESRALSSARRCASLVLPGLSREPSVWSAGERKCLPCACASARGSPSEPPHRDQPIKSGIPATWIAGTDTGGLPGQCSSGRSRRLRMTLVARYRRPTHRSGTPAGGGPHGRPG